MKKIIIAIIIFTVVTGAAYFVGRSSVKEVKPEIIEIDLTDSQILQVQQEARLNWIPLDSAMTWIEGLEAVDGINWHDSTRWSFKDSTILNIKDSINIIYIPFYEARDTIVQFDEIVEQTRVELSLAVKPRFFPTIERFVTDVQMRKLVLTRPIEVESWWKHRWTIYIGYGIMYYKSTITTRTNTIFVGDDYNGFNNNIFMTNTETEWRFDHGIQLGIGFRIY